jgi:membrane protein DedA with SNARE-associated domain
VPLAAGVSNYPRNRAFVLGGISILIWNGLLTTMALVLHENWDTVASHWRAISIGFWVVIGLIGIVILVRYYRHRSSRDSAS